MFQSKEEFLQSWKYEAEATKKIYSKLTDESLKQQITSENWDLGRLAWHIVTSIKNIGSQSGLNFDAPAEELPVPTSAEFIVESYQKSSNAFVEAVSSEWTDQTLSAVRNIFGREMSIGTLLVMLLQHQIHHRGQMTVLMRQAGLEVPGLYGPSKEEWERMIEAQNK